MSCCPSVIDLNVANAGAGAQFVITYGKVDKNAVWFPFISTPVDKLAFSGSAGLQSASYEDPLVGGVTETTHQRMIGRQVKLIYQMGEESDELTTAEGLLVQLDEKAAVLDTGKGVLAVRASAVSEITAHELSGEPTMRIQVADAAAPLVVRGLDSQFSFTTSHTVLLEPNPDSMTGDCTATISTYAAILNGYRWPLDVRQLTLTEHERGPTPVLKRREDYRAVVTTLEEAQSTGVFTPASSLQSASVQLKSPITLSGTTAGPTVAVVSAMRLDKAQWHLLGTFDPAETNKMSISMDLVVRLKRSAENHGFLLSGPASLLLDMDPLPGDAHISPTPLSLGFYHDAWDKINHLRMYHRLGPTMLVTAKSGIPDGAEPKELVKENKYVTYNTIVFGNTTPYNVVCKLYMRSLTPSRVITDVRQRTVIRQPRVLISAYVPEREGDVLQHDTRTLTVIVPPNTPEFEVPLEVDYYKRKDESVY